MIGVDYSGAASPESRLPGLRVYVAEGDAPPLERRPERSPRRHWTRRALAEWLEHALVSGEPAIVGLDHGLSFPLEYFDAHALALDWDSFLDDFAAHWPVDARGSTVESLRRGAAGAVRGGRARWRRLTEIRAGGAKSVFHFDVPGSVAKSTHAGLPWIRRLRRRIGPRVHFWPFDGWEIPAGRSVVLEAYPALWSAAHARGRRTPDQHDAYVIARQLQQALASGSFTDWLNPVLTGEERTRATIEGWILGVR